MGLLDAIAGQVMGSLGQGGSSGLVDAIGGLIAQNGGLGGLADRFRDGGLGDVVDSWISTGHNLPISGDQIRAVLGSDEVRRIASQLGLSPDAVAGQLAHVLPQVVDHVTPSGAVPDDDTLASLLGKLKGLAG